MVSEHTVTHIILEGIRTHCHTHNIRGYQNTLSHT